MRHYFAGLLHAVIGISTCCYWYFYSNSFTERKKKKHVTFNKEFLDMGAKYVYNTVFYIQYALVPSMNLIVKRYCSNLQVICESAEAGGNSGQCSSRTVRSSVLIAAAQRRACGRSGLSLSRSG